MEEYQPPPPPYSDEFFRELLAEFNIAPDREIALKRFLEGSSDSWHWQKHKSELIQPVQEILRLTQQLSKSSMAMMRSVDEMPPGLWEDLCSNIYGIGPHEYAPSTKIDPYDGCQMTFPIGNPPFKEISLSLGELSTILYGIGEIAFEINCAVSPRKRGRKTDYRLGDWIRRAAHFWERELDRKFTRDFLDGAPVSQAARFCVKAYRVLAPDTPTTLIDTAMKRQIATIRERIEEEKNGNHY